MNLVVKHHANPRRKLPQIGVTNLRIHEFLKDGNQYNQFRLRDHDLFQLLAQYQCSTAMLTPELSDKLAKTKRALQSVIWQLHWRTQAMVNLWLNRGHLMPYWNKAVICDIDQMGAGLIKKFEKELRGQGQGR